MQWGMAFLIELSNGSESHAERTPSLKKLGHMLQHCGSQRSGLLNALSHLGAWHFPRTLAVVNILAALKKIPVSPYPTVYHPPLRWASWSLLSIIFLGESTHFHEKTVTMGNQLQQSYLSLLSHSTEVSPQNFDF